MQNSTHTQIEGIVKSNKMGMVRLRRRRFHRIYRYRNYGSLMDIKPQWFNHKSIISDISLNKPKVDVEGFIKHNLGRVIDRHKERTDLKNKLQSEGTQLKNDICEAPIEFTPYTKIHSHKLQKPKKKFSDTATSYFKIISVSNIKIPKAVKIKLSTKNSIDRDEIHWQVITKSEELVITLCDSKQDEVNYDATKEESKSTREETTLKEEEEDTTYQEQCPAEGFEIDNEICHSDEFNNKTGDRKGKEVREGKSLDQNIFMNLWIKRGLVLFHKVMIVKAERGVKIQQKRRIMLIKKNQP